MENNGIEKMLCEAKDELPITNAEWKISEIENMHTQKKRFHINKVAVACLAFILLLGAGGVTVLANMEMDINPHEYSQWSDIRSGQGAWKRCEKWMHKRGFAVPENFGDYKFSTCSAWLVAKQGDTYWDALVKNVYNPISIRYEIDEPEQVKEEPGISVGLGTLDEAYWSAYYGYENVDGIWRAVDSEEIYEYSGMTLFGESRNYESDQAMHWTWIDEANNICWSVTVLGDSGMDSMDVVKTIIDLNK